jgi:hypothetical protein
MVGKGCSEVCAVLAWGRSVGKSLCMALLCVVGPLDSRGVSSLVGAAMPRCGAGMVGHAVCLPRDAVVDGVRPKITMPAPEAGMPMPVVLLLIERWQPQSGGGTARRRGSCSTTGRWEPRGSHAV